MTTLRYRILQAPGTETLPNDSYKSASSHDVENVLTMGVIWLTHAEHTGFILSPKEQTTTGVYLAFRNEQEAGAYQDDPDRADQPLLVATVWAP